jgi:hypothetical protein
MNTHPKQYAGERKVTDDTQQGAVATAAFLKLSHIICDQRSSTRIAAIKY